MTHIVTINAGNYLGQGVHYTNVLFDSVRRNLAEGFEGTFTVFTDNTDEVGYSEGIEVRQLPVPGLDGWWTKLSLFKAGVFDDGERILWLDLDSVITGRLDEIAAYEGGFAILRDFYRPHGLQSSVMMWSAGEMHWLWDYYDFLGCPQDQPSGDQGVIEAGYGYSSERRPVILQDEFPGLFASYKADRLERSPPDTASVCVFHGLPRPHEVLTGWVPDVWKIGGLMRADLDLIANTGSETLERNVKSAAARDLFWLGMEDPHDRQVAIVGGGPSLAGCLDELRGRVSRGQQVWAINGAGRFLRGEGIEPDAIVIADARPDNAAFVMPGPIHYLASQCDPATFDAAPAGKGGGTVVWHVNSPGMADLLAGERERPVHLIGGGSTCGLNAMVLAYVMGYRAIHLYGFDSSYAEMEWYDGNDTPPHVHHAYPQPLNDGERVIEVLFEGHRFKASGWMAAQANEFQDTATMLANEGCVITVAGTGLIPTIARHMMLNPVLTPAQVRAQEVLSRIPDAIIGAEIGVFTGEMSAALFEASQALCLDMVDSWEGDGSAYEGDSGDWHAGLSQDAQDRYAKLARERTEFARNRRTIFKMRSVAAARSIKFAYYDFVFIDADHSYEGCKADIEAWAPKVRSGGLLCGHDYENERFPKFGVTRAVNEYVERTGLSLELGENYTWFIRIP